LHNERLLALKDNSSLIRPMVMRSFCVKQ
jgi:hypothetical protein